MMKSVSPYLVFIALTTLSLVANGQGCSDAGFCTLNSFKPNAADSTYQHQNQLKTGVSYGIADHDITVIGAYIEYNKFINHKFSVDTKITMLSQSNSINTSTGIADLYLNANYRLSNVVSITLGTKIPFSDGNKTLNGQPLPMDFQPSLGTLDLIAGLGLVFGKWQIIAAIQQPLTQNKNAFIANSFPPGSAFRQFQTTNNYQRSGDILLRLSYPLTIGSKLKITPSLLPIYHLANDRFTDTDGIEKEIAGSRGLTLNANAYVDLYLNHKNSLQFNIGAPLVIREARPDGLTRHFLVAVEYRFLF